MVKSELMTGMIITNRKGEKYMVFKNIAVAPSSSSGDVLVDLNKRSWDDLESYNEDMTCVHDSKFDIMKVEKCKYTADLLHPNRDTITVWERKKKKTYTYAQLRDILGSEFEVVG